jgi:hypothetical protein
MKIIKVAIPALILSYLVSYSANSLMGGYYNMPDADFNSPPFYSFGGTAPIYILWQPRFGHMSKRKVDVIGYIYYPLIRLDRTFFHKTKSMADEDFYEWADEMIKSNMIKNP